MYLPAYHFESLKFIKTYLGYILEVEVEAEDVEERRYCVCMDRRKGTGICLDDLDKSI